MNNDEIARFDAVLRTDFVRFLYRCFLWLNPGATFLPNWHIRAIAYQLERIRRGEINRLIINLPPRYLKSITVSVAFPLFLLGPPGAASSRSAMAMSCLQSTQAISDRLRILLGTGAPFRTCASRAAPKAN